MFKLRNVIFFCTKLAHFKFDVLVWSFSVEFDPILAWYMFPSAEGFMVIFDVFLFKLCAKCSL